MKQFTVDKFGGQNNYIDATKIAPNEFVSLSGATTESESIQKLNTFQPEYWPTPQVQSFGGFDVNTSSISNSVTVAQNTSFYLKVNSAIRAGDVKTLYLMVKGDGVNSTVTPRLIANGANPNGADITDHIQYPCLGDESAIITENVQWRVFNLTASADSAVGYWIGLEVGSAASLGDCTVYTHASSAGETWEQPDGTTFQTAYGGAENPVCLIGSCDIKSSHLEEWQNVNLGFFPQTNYITAPATRQLPPSFNGCKSSFCLLYAPRETDYKFRILMDSKERLMNHPLTFAGARYVYVIPKITIAKEGNIIFLTHPSTKYCVPLAVTKEGTSGSYVFPHKLDVAYFRERFIFNTWGASYGQKYPLYIQTKTLTNAEASPHTKSFTGTVPRHPLFVDVFGLSLVFTGDAADQNYNQLWYSEAGQIDSFTGVESLSHSSPVIATEVFNNQMLFFFLDKTKALSGVFGAAFLQEIFPMGIISTNCVTVTPVGLFFINNDGLFFYNGHIQPILDLTTIINDYMIDTDEIRYTYNADESLILAWPKKNQIWIFLHSYGDTAFCIIYDYVTRKYCTTLLASGSGLQKLKKPVLFGWEEFPALIHGSSIKRIVDINFENVLTPTFAALIAESGWIDIDPAVENKLFQFISVECSATSAETFVNLYVYLENGKTFSFTNIDLNQSGDYYRIHKSIPGQGKRIKYKITSAITTKQVKIHRVTVHYEPGKTRG